MPGNAQVFVIFNTMNKTPTAKRVMTPTMLVEGMSMRSISRTVGVSINTVTKLMRNW